MRRSLFTVLATIVLITPSAGEQRVSRLPEILIGGDVPTTAASEKCVEVEVGASRAFNCLNQKFQREVNRVNPSMNTPPVDARSSDIRIGVVNLPAVQQQYGRNYGVSVIPQRPATPVFSSPLGPR